MQYQLDEVFIMVYLILFADNGVYVEVYHGQSFIQLTMFLSRSTRIVMFWTTVLHSFLALGMWKHVT